MVHMICWPLGTSICALFFFQCSSVNGRTAPRHGHVTLRFGGGDVVMRIDTTTTTTRQFCINPFVVVEVG